MVSPPGRRVHQEVQDAVAVSDADLLERDRAEALLQRDPGGLIRGARRGRGTWPGPGPGCGRRGDGQRRVLPAGVEDHREGHAGRARRSLRVTAGQNRAPRFMPDCRPSRSPSLIEFAMPFAAALPAPFCDSGPCRLIGDQRTVTARVGAFGCADAVLGSVVIAAACWYLPRRGGQYGRAARIGPVIAPRRGADSGGSGGDQLRTVGADRLWLGHIREGLHELIQVVGAQQPEQPAAMIRVVVGHQHVVQGRNPRRHAHVVMGYLGIPGQPRIDQPRPTPPGGRILSDDQRALARADIE